MGGGGWRGEGRGGDFSAGKSTPFTSTSMDEGSAPV